MFGVFYKGFYDGQTNMFADGEGNFDGVSSGFVKSSGTNKIVI